MSSYSASLLARRVASTASRRLIINPRTVSSVATEAASADAAVNAAKNVGNQQKLRMGRCGGRYGPARGVAKVGVLGLATYGGYKLVKSDTPTSSPPGAPSTIGSA